MVTSSGDASVEVQLANCGNCDTVRCSACDIDDSCPVPQLVEDLAGARIRYFARVRQLYKRTMVTVPSSEGRSGDQG
jgi:hypothetical protein